MKPISEQVLESLRPVIIDNTLVGTAFAICKYQDSTLLATASSVIAKVNRPEEIYIDGRQVMEVMTVDRSEVAVVRIDSRLQISRLTMQTAGTKVNVTGYHLSGNRSVQCVARPGELEPATRSDSELGARHVIELPMGSDLPRTFVGAPVFQEGNGVLGMIVIPKGAQRPIVVRLQTLDAISPELIERNSLQSGKPAETLVKKNACEIDRSEVWATFTKALDVNKKVLGFAMLASAWDSPDLFVDRARYWMSSGSRTLVFHSVLSKGRGPEKIWEQELAEMLHLPSSSVPTEIEVSKWGPISNAVTVCILVQVECGNSSWASIADFMRDFTDFWDGVVSKVSKLAVRIFFSLSVGDKSDVHLKGLLANAVKRSTEMLAKTKRKDSTNPRIVSLGQLSDVPKEEFSAWLQRQVDDPGSWSKSVFGESEALTMSDVLNSMKKGGLV